MIFNKYLPQKLSVHKPHSNRVGWLLAAWVCLHAARSVVRESATRRFSEPAAKGRVYLVVDLATRFYLSGKATYRELVPGCDGTNIYRCCVSSHARPMRFFPVIARTRSLQISNSLTPTLGCCKFNEHDVRVFYYAVEHNPPTIRSDIKSPHHSGTAELSQPP